MFLIMEICKEILIMADDVINGTRASIEKNMSMNLILATISQKIFWMLLLFLKKV